MLGLCYDRGESRDAVLHVFDRHVVVATRAVRQRAVDIDIAVIVRSQGSTDACATAGGPEQLALRIKLDGRQVLRNQAAVRAKLADRRASDIDVARGVHGRSGGVIRTVAAITRRIGGWTVIIANPQSSAIRGQLGRTEGATPDDRKRACEVNVAVGAETQRTSTELRSPKFISARIDLPCPKAGDIDLPACIQGQRRASFARCRPEPRAISSILD